MQATTTGERARPARIVPPFAGAATILEAVARRDFDSLAGALRDDVHLRALLPRGFKEWYGPQAVAATFHGWFGGFAELEMIDAVVGEVGRRVHLRWRLRARPADTAGQWLVVEQQVYADAEPGEPIHRLSLLCSGFSHEAPGE